jgi:hypothetical protein
VSLTLYLDGPAAVIHDAVRKGGGREEGREGGVKELERTVCLSLFTSTGRLL